MIGVDLVYLPEFSKNVESGGGVFLERTFLPGELQNKKLEHLAGLFAAKEAVIKALDLPVGSWLKVEITNGGKPRAIVDGRHTVEVSISHHGDYAVAMAIKNAT
jgi:phosphopantetheine--protein transferase-like protein